MRRQRKDPQMKGKEEASERMLNEIEEGNYQIMSSKQWLSGSSMSSQKITKNYRETTMNSVQTISTQKKEIETINKGQEEMKNTISELKNTVEGIKSRLEGIKKDRISELEDKVEKKTPERARKGRGSERMKRD